MCQIIPKYRILILEISLFVFTEISSMKKTCFNFDFIVHQSSSIRADYSSLNGNEGRPKTPNEQKNAHLSDLPSSTHFFLTQSKSANESIFIILIRPRSHFKVPFPNSEMAYLKFKVYSVKQQWKRDKNSKITWICRRKAKRNCIFSESLKIRRFTLEKTIVKVLNTIESLNLPQSTILRGISEKITVYIMNWM